MGLMDTKASYADLARKYGQFRVPAAKLYVDNKELTGVNISQISVTLSLEAASAVNFTVEGAYDRKSSGFDPGIKNKLKLGAIVCLELGYRSALTEVFQGFICEVGVDFSDLPRLNITAMDARRLMMEGTSREETHVVTTYSAAFEAVMKRYSVLCPTLKVDATDANEIIQIVQRSSDYEFVSQELTHKANREFFILGDTAYFRDPTKVKGAITTLTWGEGLLTFSRNSMYQNLKITVIGFDPEKKTAVSAQVTEKSADQQKAVGAQHETVITDPDAWEQAKAKKRAEKEARKRREKAQQGSASCVGLPELVPGRFVAMKGLDKDLDKEYYIKEVRHEFGSDGFTTTLEMGGWSG